MRLRLAVGLAALTMLSAACFPDPGPGTPTDSDGDRLADSVETNTGHYIDATHTGTDPHRADSDGDAVKDGDEVLGTTAGLNLKAMGFNPNHKDVALEVDWYDDDEECGSAHSHRPTPGMISNLTAAFAGVNNITNPDGVTGINFIADYGQGGAFTGGSLISGPANSNLVFDFDGPGGGFGVGTDFHTRKAPNFDPKRNGYFYYGLSSHRLEEPNGTIIGAVGIGQFNGDDISIAADCSNANDALVYNLVFHELGHDFGLGHGGADFENYKPNYVSTMNYYWGDNGIDTNCDGVGDGVLGFSSGEKPDLDENALIEANGICGPGPGHAIDWNQNGIIDAAPIAYDLNPQNGDGLTILEDSNDIALISFAGLNDAD